MSRALTSGMQTALVASTIYPFFLFECTLTSGTLYLADTQGDVTWNGNVYLGNGWFKGFSDVPETNDSASQSIDVDLSGVPAAMVSTILGSVNHSCRGKVYLGLFNTLGASIIADPYLLFLGALSAPRSDDSVTDSFITLTFVDDLAMLNRTKELRNNTESHQALFPADKFFNYVPRMVDWTGFFGNKNKPKKPPVRRPRRRVQTGRKR